MMEPRVLMNYLKHILSLALLTQSITCFAFNSEKDLIKRINTIEKQSHSVIGISAIHIEKNKTITHNGNEHFFMASTIKLPIALAFLNRVDKKKESLSHMIKLGLNHSVPGSGTLYHLCEKNKTKMSLQQILGYMLKNSDNSASDIVLHAAHGPEEVTKQLRALGFKNTVVNRSILEMFMDSNHVNHALLKEPRTVSSWKRVFNSVPLKQKVEAWKRFERDPRDTTTPDEMANILVKLYKNQILSESSTQLLLKIMEQCRTGRSRIRGLLPGNVKVAHKTGTWAIGERNYLNYPGSKQLFRFASDVGIITLPKDKGHIAIAIYVKSKDASDYPRTRAIALTSKAIYDHFMKDK